MKTTNGLLVTVLLASGCSLPGEPTATNDGGAPLLDSIAWDYGDPEVESEAQRMCGCLTDAWRATGDKDLVDGIIKDGDAMLGMTYREREAHEDLMNSKYGRNGLNLNGDMNAECMDQIKRDWERMQNTQQGRRKLYLVQKTLELKCVMIRAMERNP